MTPSPSNSALTDAVRAVIGEALQKRAGFGYNGAAVVASQIAEDLSPMLAAIERMHHATYADVGDGSNEDPRDSFDAALADLSSQTRLCRRNDAK